MFKVLCITMGDKKRGIFAKDEIIREEIIFDKLGVLVELAILKTKKNKIKKKTIKKLEKLCSGEENIYTDIDSIKSLEKNKNNTKVINYLPLASFKKWVNVNGISPVEDEFALVVGGLEEKEKNLIMQIASKVKLMTVYNCKEKSFLEEIMKETGLCVKFSDEEIKEKAVIYTGDSLAFENKQTGEKVYDIRLSLPKEMAKYKNLPMERILENALKTKEGEKLLRKNKVKINGFYRT